MEKSNDVAVRIYGQTSKPVLCHVLQHGLSVPPYLSHFLYNITLSCWLSFLTIQHGACHFSLPYALHLLIRDKQSTCKANNGRAVGSQSFALNFRDNRGLELSFGTLRCVYW